jgi:RNase adaptor protein for sRNA GlmZ degradation
MITINLPPELNTVLADMMRETGKSAEQIALEALLERLEDFEDVRVAEERLRNPSGPNIPLEKLMQKYGLLDDEGQHNKPAAE